MGSFFVAYKRVR